MYKARAGRRHIRRGAQRVRRPRELGGGPGLPSGPPLHVTHSDILRTIVDIYNII